MDSLIPRKCRVQYQVDVPTSPHLVPIGIKEDVVEEEQLRHYGERNANNEEVDEPFKHLENGPPSIVRIVYFFAVIRELIDDFIFYFFYRSINPLQSIASESMRILIFS